MLIGQKESRDSTCCSIVLRIRLEVDADRTKGVEGLDLLQHCSKNSFRRLALQASLVAVVP